MSKTIALCVYDYLVGARATWFLSQHGHDDMACGHEYITPCKSLEQLLYNYYNVGRNEEKKLEKMLRILTDISIFIDASIMVSTFILTIRLTISKI